jgi:hypothetical protein
MRPESKSNQNNQYQPRWRHFHPNDILYVKNPFDFDIVFQVADEYNQPWQYKLPQGKVSELPGGMIATLGLKEIVDRMVANGGEAIRIWDPLVRSRYEKAVIVRLKEAPQRGNVNGPAGPVDLTSSDDDIVGPALEGASTQPKEKAFPGANRRPKVPAPALAKTPGGRPADNGVAATAEASLGSGTQLIEEE